MHLTIFLAVIAALMQALTTWLAFHVSASPDVLNDKRKMQRYRIAFVGLLLIGIVVAVISAYRGTKVERVHMAITEIRPITKPRWPIIGEPLEVNIHFKNVGNGMAFNTVLAAYTVLKPDHSAYSEQQTIAEFEKWLQTQPMESGASLAKDNEMWDTSSGAILTPEDHNNLLTGRKVMYLVGVLQFRDDFGKHLQRICRFLQPPGPTGGGGYKVFGILAGCSQYNDEVDGRITR